jgi:DNA (cytosine-5)-methyltransferase 1
MRKAVGITSGIGSLLVGAKAAGFDVVGNIEWRQYYHLKDGQGTNTFQAAFPRAVFKEHLEDMSLDEIQRMMGADLAMGHPECGRYSRLSGSVKNRDLRAKDPSDIPLFVDLVARLKPKFFVMDDLPKSLDAYPMEKYAEKLPDYDLFPEWVSNWGYGNVQKGRDRMFMLGALRDQHWAFTPGEQVHTRTVADVIGDLPEPRRGLNIPNHEPHDGTLDCFRALNLGGYRNKSTWAEVQEHFKDKGGGYTLEYPTKEGRMVKRIGFLKGHWDGPSHVLTGGNAILQHHRCDPYTIRERARIQGFPDDFVFYGTEVNRRGEWNHDMNSALVKQTGKAMPVQFAEYVAKQVMAHLEGRPPGGSGQRVIHSNEDVDRAKRWYCGVGPGYSDQERACSTCWMAARCEIRTDRYGLPAIPGRAVARSQGLESRPKPRGDNVRPNSMTHSRKTSHKVDIVREPVQTERISLKGART